MSARARMHANHRRRDSPTARARTYAPRVSSALQEHITHTGTQTARAHAYRITQCATHIGRICARAHAATTKRASFITRQASFSTQHVAHGIAHVGELKKSIHTRAHMRAHTHACKPPMPRLIDGPSAYICAARIERTTGTHLAHRHTNCTRTRVPKHALRNTHRAHMRKRARSDDQTRFIQHAPGFFQRAARST